MRCQSVLHLSQTFNTLTNNLILTKKCFALYTMSSKTLDKIFNDPKTGFVGEEKLFRRAHSIDPDITRKMVKDYLKENEVHQLFSKPQKQSKNPKIHGEK